jgi:hypothetical protein
MNKLNEYYLWQGAFLGALVLCLFSLGFNLKWVLKEIKIDVVKSVGWIK